MPIRDGYSATHAIRTDFDTSPDVRNIPIIAMTASAIQGDREKCEQAGMDVSDSTPPLVEDGSVSLAPWCAWSLASRYFPTKRQGLPSILVAPLPYTVRRC